MSKMVVEGKFCKAGSSVRIDGTFVPLTIDAPKDGYVFLDPERSNYRTYMSKNEFETKYELAPPPEPTAAPVGRQTVKAEPCKAGSHVKIDGNFSSMVIEAAEDGYVFKDPKNNGARTYLPKADFDAKYDVAIENPAQKAKPPAPPKF